MLGSGMAQDYIHPLQALRAVMVQKRRKLAESLLRSRKRTKVAKRRKKLIKLQREIDVIDDAIADEQLLSPSLREQLAKEWTGEDKVTSRIDPATEPMERVKARLTELTERLTGAGSAKVSTPSPK
jgi:chromosome segregation ATPase